MSSLNEEKPIVIVGAGISGLTLSILLRQLGKKVILLEKRPVYSPEDTEDQRSFNITITERGMKSLRAIGVEQSVLKHSVAMKSRIIHLPSSCICNSEVSEQSYGEQENDRLYSIPRTTLVNLLYEESKKSEHAQIYFDSEVIEIDKNDAVVVVQNRITREKSNFSYSLLIGADGAYSKIRSYLLLGEIVDFHISYFDWFYKKFVISADDGKVLKMAPQSLHVFPKKGGLVVAIPNQDKSFSCIYCTKISDPSDVKSERAMQEIERKFQKDFPHIYGLSSLLRKTFTESKISGLVTVNISQWTSSGNIVLVGDAAHAVFPFYGQGMNSAMHDCRKLVEALQKTNSIEEAITNYEHSQKASTDALSELCKKHFHYLQQGCTSKVQEAQQTVNKFLAKFFPDIWESEYRMVAQTDLPYNQIVAILKRQSMYRKIFAVFIFDYLLAFGKSILKKIQKPLHSEFFQNKKIFQENEIA